MNIYTDEKTFLTACRRACHSINVKHPAEYDDKGQMVKPGLGSRYMAIHIEEAAKRVSETQEQYEYAVKEFTKKFGL